MKFNQLNGFAFDKKSGALGAIAGINFLNQTMNILKDDNTTVTASLSDVTFLEQIGYIGQQGVMNHDVLGTIDGSQYEIELLANGTQVQLHLLDKKLQRVEAGDVIAVTDLAVLEPYVTVVGSIFELEVETLDFNIRVVRHIVDGDVRYSYACNNVEKEEIDLIKVVFIGHKLLEEESYERETISHEEYSEAVESGKLKEVNPQELMNYVTGLTYGQTPTVDYSNRDDAFEDELDLNDFEDEEVDEGDCECPACRYNRGEIGEDELDRLLEEEDSKDEDEDFEEEDYCEDCNESVEDCECRGW